MARPDRRRAAGPDRIDRELDLCLRADRVRLRRRRRKRESQAAFDAELHRCQARRATREAARPEPQFDDALPIVVHREAIAAAIAAHPVVVVCGETGSGKSTQLPKICLTAGRGSEGFIGHTQPRRIAARSIAARVAQELGGELGGAVGYKIRFRDRVSEDAYIKVVTDGMLLAEIAHDRDLDRYDTLIIDEAHERSLNIDFLLGYLKRLLARRPDLKLIVTSATIDPQRFSRHFDDAPVIEVSGRTYPVEVRYRPLAQRESDTRERDLEVAILKAVDELAAEEPGDVLVFLPGERDIRMTADLLKRRRLRHTEILPLYARLSGAEQQRIFQAHGGRRIVLATNIAETSLTVPGIKYVIDTGLARVSRYRPGRQIQSLPIEPVSQAAADQRMGRCGRTSDGICIRLYSAADYTARPRFTDPEILRTSLAAVILMMAHMDLGEIDAFPFIEPPTPRAVKDGYRLLEELGAVDEEGRVTELGRQLARLPIDPRLARMLLEAGQQGCVDELLTITAALSIVDPREYPEEHRDAARAIHAEHTVKDSDFLSLLSLWRHYRAHTRELTERQTRRYCRSRFLSYVRMREWAEVRAQLAALARRLKLGVNPEPASEPAIHRAILSGLLGNIARLDTRHEYLGTRGKKLYVHPSSTTFKRTPKWIMAAELVDTERLYARMVAAIDPVWAEPLAGKLLRRDYLEPYWSREHGRVMAYEQVSLYGLTLVSRREVDFGPEDAGAARQIFIDQALVAGNIDTGGSFLQHNQDLIQRIEALEHRSRRRDVLVDARAMFDFYAARLPAGIYTTVTFERWRKRAEKTEPRLLHMTRDDLLRRDDSDITRERFPDHIDVAANRLEVTYRFEPGHPNDGVTVRVPVALLPQLDAACFSWLVPGLLLEKLIALIKSLPKALRRRLVPAPDYAERSLERLRPGDGSLEVQLARVLSEAAGAEISAGDFDLSKLAPHLHMNFAVTDNDGTMLASGRDLDTLKLQLAEPASAAVAALAPPRSLEREGISHWDFDTLPETVEYRSDGVTVRGHPALVDRGADVAIEVFETAHTAATKHRDGVLRLLMLELGQQTRYLRKNLPGIDRMCLNFAAVAPCSRLRADLLHAAFGSALAPGQRDCRDAQDFAAARERLRHTVVETANDLCAEVGAILERYRQVALEINQCPGPTGRDARAQLELLVFPGFVSVIPERWRSQLQRYLQALSLRLDRARHDPQKDADKRAQLHRHWDRLLLFKYRLEEELPEPLLTYRWLLEEYRVSLFAQQLKTRVPVSEKRLEDAWAEVRSRLLET